MDVFEDDESSFNSEEREREKDDRPWYLRAVGAVRGSLNFYRIHLMAFTFIPLILSAIMWGCNTEYEIAYIDCLFVCVSAMTVTGLASINLSTLSGWQQTIIFLQMCIGNIVAVSLVTILVRQHFFRQEFNHIIKQRVENKRLAEERDREKGGFPLSPRSAARRLSQSFAGMRPGFIKDGDAPGEKPVHQHPSDAAPPIKRGWFHLGKPAGIGGKTSDDRSDSSSERYGETAHSSPAPPPPPTKKKEKKRKFTGKLRTDMIKRVEGGGFGVNPMGWYHQDQEQPRRDVEEMQRARADTLQLSSAPPAGEQTNAQQTQGSPAGILENPQSAPAAPVVASDSEDPHRRSLDPAPKRISLDPQSAPAQMTVADGAGDEHDPFPRSKTIAFNDPDDEIRAGQRSALLNAREAQQQIAQANANATYGSHGAATGYMPRTGTIRPAPTGYGLDRTATGRRSVAPGRTLGPTMTFNTGLYSRTYTSGRQASVMHSGFGGFPTPLQVAQKLVKKFFPKAHNKLARTMSIQRTSTVASRNSIGAAKEVPYISFDAFVGRNSLFHGLTNEQHDELGGVEYRALRALFWIVLLYFVGVQLTAFIIIGPYTAAGGRYNSVFDNQFRVVPIYWFAAFQSVSAFSNLGMSLADQSMLPFQTAYVMIFAMILLIFAGNTAFPIFLRLIIWLLSKMSPLQSRFRETLQFLLDHPRRCFIYMFPSTQTWFLAFIMFCLTMTDFVSFMVLDIGTPEIEAIPVGTRIASGLLQSAAVRAAGFGIVPLAALAPAVKVLYVIMMYIAVYPIAMSVRSTNVYEERSLGVFGDEAEEEPEDSKPGAEAVAKYLGFHARRQLAFDIWWIGFALWLVCIIERSSINNPDNYAWFNIFNIIFELVSAYGTVGLSLGVPYDNYSFSGSFKTLSKLVVCAVMIRGRHRGLPVAIDRAVMLPRDFTAAEVTALDEEALSRRMSRMTGVSAERSRRGSITRSGRMNSVSSGGGGAPTGDQASGQAPWLADSGSIARAESPTSMSTGERRLGSGTLDDGREGRRRNSNNLDERVAAVHDSPAPRGLSPVKEALSRAATRREEPPDADASELVGY